MTQPPDIFTDAAAFDHVDDTVAIIRHDARQLPLADESVDLIVTSPPYYALRSYRDDGDHYDGQLGSEDTPDQFITNLIDCTREWMRVLKPSGSMFVNLGDKYAGSRPDGSSGNGQGTSSLVGHGGEGSDRDIALNPQRGPRRSFGNAPPKSRMLLPHRYAIACIDTLGLTVRMDMIWSKPNGLPESVTDRVRASHEYWFHLVKQQRYFSGLDEIRQPTTNQNPGALAQSSPEVGFVPSTEGDRHRQAPRDPDLFNPLGRLPGSVWNIPSEPLIIPDQVRDHYDLPDHFAAFPQEWPRRLIQAFSPTGICTECDQPCTLIVDVSPMEITPSPRRAEAQAHGAGSGRTSPSGTMTKPSERTITGYACACPTPDAPTRPAIILDPFGGTGTTAGVARTLGRYGITNDLSADYNRLARWRILESGHFTKTERKRWADRQRTLI